MKVPVAESNRAGVIMAVRTLSAPPRLVMLRWKFGHTFYSGWAQSGIRFNFPLFSPISDL